MQHVEGNERGDAIDRPGPTAAAHQAPTSRGKVGLAVHREVHELAIQGHAMRAQHLGELDQLGKLGTALAAGSRAKRPRAPAVDAQLGAQAVPLELQRPVIAHARRQPAAREHRLNEARKLFRRRVHPCHAQSLTAGTRGHARVLGTRTGGHPRSTDDAA